MTGHSPWTDTKQVRLVELWAEGLSAREIAMRLAVSRSAVIGKAHRLGLSPRASPIKRALPAPQEVAA